MSIGDALAQARHQAGLTVTEVSRRTRIREVIIKGIEDGDYSGCGGDFYTRGHIRSMARVVGIDPEPLIQEYDVTRLGPEGGPEDVTEPIPRIRVPPRHRRIATVALGLALVAVLGLAGYLLLSSSPRVTPAASRAHARPVAHHRAGRLQPAAAPSSASAAAPATPTPTITSTPAQQLPPVRAVAFGVQGAGRGDAPQLAHNAIDGNPGTAWHTDWYTTARFGNLYAGTGLLVDMGRPATITAARIALGQAHGAAFQLRVGPRPALADLAPVASASDAGGRVRLSLARPAHGRYVLIWFTRLPRDQSGTFQATVRNLKLEGHY